MKKTILLITFILSFINSNAQYKFKWDVTDSVPKTKEQIYSDTKVFIAKTWRSAQNVIQNDDKEAGNIIVVGNSIHKVFYSLNTYNFVYRYTIEFKMKDGKYKIIIDNVYCYSNNPEKLNSFKLFKIEPFDAEYIKQKSFFGGPGNLPEEKAVDLIVSLKAHLQSIVNEYRTFMKTENSNSNDW